MKESWNKFVNDRPDSMTIDAARGRNGTRSLRVRPSHLQECGFVSKYEFSMRVDYIGASVVRHHELRSTKRMEQTLQKDSIQIKKPASDFSKAGSET